MKHLLYLVIAVFMVSCGSGSLNSKYEETIRAYLLKDKSAADFNFKVEELAEQGTVTVADSIAYLTDEFRKDKQLIISRIELARKMTEDLLSKTKRQSDIDRYNADIARISNSVDSLKNLAPDNLQGYDGRNAGDVLVQIVRCKYSIQPPGASPVMETFDFYLSPDGSKCYAKTRTK